MIEKVQLEERTSQKGNPYKVLVITFKNGYQKIVFLEKSELYMLEALAQNK